MIEFIPKNNDGINMQEKSFKIKTFKSLSFRLTMIASIVLLSLCYGVYAFLSSIEKEKLVEQLFTEGSTYINSFESSIEQRLYALDRMAGRFESDSEKYKTAWLKDVKNYVRYYKGFQAIEWADKDSKVQWVYPAVGNEGVIGAILNQEERRNEALKYTKHEKIGAFTEAIELKQGGKGFLSIHPVEDSQKYGYIVGVYRANDLIPLFTSEKFLLKVKLNNDLIYDEFTEDKNEFLFKYSLYVRNVSFSIEIIPSIFLLEPYYENLLKYKIIILSVFLVLLFATVLLFKSKDEVGHIHSKFKSIWKAIDSYAAVTEVDIHGNIISVNKNLLQLTKYNRNELIGQSYKKLLSSELDQKIYADIWKRVIVGQIWGGDIKSNAKDGSVYWGTTTIFPTYDKKGKIENIISIVLDKTREFEQQESVKVIAKELDVINQLLNLNFSQDKTLLSILQEAMDILLEIPWLKLMKRGGIFLEENNEAQLIVSNDMDIFVEEICSTLININSDCYQKLKKADVIYSKDIKAFEAMSVNRINLHSHYIVPLVFENELLGMLVFYLPNAHEPKEKEEKFLKSCADVLTKIIVSSRKELDLLRSRNSAIKAEKVKSEFLANMSHEIRTPLNGVLGMVQLLSETELTEQQKDMMNTIQSSGESLLVILNDILDISKLESGKIEIEKVNFNLKKSLSDAIKLFEYKAKEKELELSLNYDDNLPEWFFGDVTRIRQIIVNFVSNSIKFSDKGKIDLLVSGENNTDESKVKISVKDYGIGISNEEKKKLFKAFSQGDNSITRNYGGTGLGLSICSKFAELMGGKIDVESIKGEGATFILELNLIHGQKVIEIEDKIKTDGSTHLNLGQNYPHKILVAEDNLINQKLAKMMLNKLGYESTFAKNGEEAVNILSTESDFTLVLMDIQMPKMDGLTATEHILHNLGKNAPPIVAMTANAFVEDKEKCKAVGMSDFLAKPISIKELKMILVKYSSTYVEEAS